MQCLFVSSSALMHVYSCETKLWRGEICVYISVPSQFPQVIQCLTKQSECPQFSDGIALPVSSVPVVFSGISFILSLFLLRVRVRVQSSVYSPVVQRGKTSFSALSRRRLYTLFLSGKLEFGVESLFQLSVGDTFILSLFLWRV